jgi:hypothetical protein
MPRPTSRLLPPEQFNSWQALGDFPTRFDTEGVILICQMQGRLYPFGQWTTVFGKCFVLGWCRFLDQALYDAAWLASPSDAALASEPAGAPLLLGTLTDEQVLAQFVSRVTCEGAFLTYQGESYQPTFWRYRTAAAKAWGEVAGRERDPYMQPLWSEIPLAPGTLCPATYLDVVRQTGTAHREITRARAQAYGWTEAAIAQHDALPPLRYTP